MRKDGLKEPLCAVGLLAAVHHEPGYSDGHRHLAFGDAAGAFLRQFDSLHVETYGSAVIARRGHQLGVFTKRVYKTVGRGGNAGIDFLVEHACMFLLLGQQFKHTFARTQHFGAKLHCHQMIGAETVGIVRQQWVDIFEYMLQLLLAHLEILESVMDFGQVEKQGYKSHTEFQITEIREFTQTVQRFHCLFVSFLVFCSFEQSHGLGAQGLDVMKYFLVVSVLFDARKFGFILDKAHISVFF